jgi:hypothetical protein
VALRHELGRVPKEQEIEDVALLAQVLYKAILGLHYKRKEQKKSGQLAALLNAYAHRLRQSLDARADPGSPT